MVQRRETKAINKLCVREILSLSFVCGAYFFEFRGRNLVFFGIAYNFERMRTAFFTRVVHVKLKLGDNALNTERLSLVITKLPIKK